MLVGKLSICNLSQALKCIGFFFFDNIVFAVKSSELVALLPNTFIVLRQYLKQRIPCTLECIPESFSALVSKPGSEPR